MFFADASGGALFPTPRHLNTPEQPTISRRFLVGFAAVVIATAAAFTTWATVRPGATTEPAAIPSAGPVAATTTPSTVPDVLGGHTPASQLLLTPNTGGSQ